MNIQISAKNLPARSLVRVPSGVGLLAFWADDPLKTSYTVLFAECKKRGIPITLGIPSTMSSLAPAGTESVALYGLLRATDAQVSEMCLKGGAGFVYHSTSHGSFSGQSDKAWFKNEVALGADIGQSLPGLVGITTTGIDRANLTPGDRISDQIPTQLSYGPTEECYLSAQGFLDPGEWYNAGESDSVEADNEYWDILRAKWGPCVMMYGGRHLQPIGAIQPMCLRHTITDKTTAEIQAIIDAAIATGTCVHMYCHEFLTSGAAGSGKVDQVYSSSISNANLVTILNYIQTKMEAGTLKVLSAGAALVAEVGTVINLLENGDLGKMSWIDPTVKPGGWARLRYAESNSASLGRRAATANDLAHVYMDRGTAGYYEVITLDVAPAVDWAAGDVITGQTSTKTSVCVVKLTTLTYLVRSRTGNYTLGEVVGVTGNNDKLADQGAAHPTFAVPANGSNTLAGWYTTFDRFDDCESFLLRGKVRVWSGLNKPRILIYGGTTSDTLKLKDGTAVYAANDIQNHVGSLTGLLNQLLYKYEFDGVDAKSVAVTETALDNTQNVVDEGGGLCSVLAGSNTLVAGDLIWFNAFANYTGVYTVHATSTVNKIVFTATYAAETVGNGDVINKLTWIPFTIPFALPKPLSRIAIVLSSGALGTASEIDFADIVLEQNGPQVDAKKTDLSDLRLAGDSTGRDRYGNVLIS